MRDRVLVAIDGPAGAGKSTVARRVAEQLGFVLVDTGALYRTVAFAATRAGVALDDGDGLGALAERLAGDRRIQFVAPQVLATQVLATQVLATQVLATHAPAAQVPAGGEDPPDSRFGGSGVRVLLDGADVSEAIRTPLVSIAASQVSAHPRVRAALLDLQRQAGEGGGVVLEGRDIGTVVFPDAEAKFFLTANAAERATRRQRELQDKGTTISFADTLAEVVQRDRADSERPVAPLRRADDALLIDSSGRDIADVVTEMVEIVRARARELAAGEPRG